MLKGILKIAFGAICLFSAAKFGPYTYGLFQQGKSSETWVMVEAQVESFKFRTTSTKGKQTSNPHLDLVYHYQIDGVKYVGNRTGFGPYSKGQLERPNRKGKINVYVNPDDPNESVYIKGISKPNLGAMLFALGIGLFGLILSGMGLLNIIKD